MIVYVVKLDIDDIHAVYGAWKSLKRAKEVAEKLRKGWCLTKEEAFDHIDVINMKVR
jgi:hypothetical protein